VGRKPKLYVPLTVTFFEDDRIIQAGDGPTLLYVAMCLKCKAMGTDGRLTEGQIERLHRRKWRAELARLAELELVLFDESSSEWFVAAWFSHNEAIFQLDAKRAADRKRKREANSGWNPDGIPADSSAKGREDKGREGKEGNPRGAHRFDDDGSGNCGTCHLPMTNALHLRLVEESA
jgi:hypothetical protein